MKTLRHSAIVRQTGVQIYLPSCLKANKTVLNYDSAFDLTTWKPTMYPTLSH